MALTLGTNSGFVWTAPTADPAGADTVIDGASVVTKHTSPAGATKIVEIGWYRGSGTNTANFEIALYAADGATVPGEAGTRLFVDATNSSSSSGWIVTTVDWSISENTVYWLALQMDAHSGTSNVDTATSSGAGYDRRTSQTALNDPYGGGALDSTTGMYAIYALVRGRKDFSDTLALTSSVPNPKLFRQVNNSDTLALTSSIDNPKLFRNVNFADTLNLTSSIPDLNLSVSTVKNFTSTLNLTSNVPNPKLFRIINFADALGLTSSIPDFKLFRLVNFSDTVALTSSISDPKLFRIVNFSDIVNLTSSIPNFNLAVGNLVDFTGSLALTSLTSEPKLFREVTFSDALALTSLIPNPKLFRDVNFEGTLDLTSSIPDFDLNLGGVIKNFTSTLDLTSETSIPKLFRVVNLSSTLDLTSLVGEFNLWTEALMFRWNGSGWEPVKFLTL